MSTLFIRAQVVTAIVTAAGQSDVRRATYELRNAIRVLDRMQLADGPGRLPQGALAALLLIAHRGGDAELLHRFAVVLERPDDAAPAERKALAPAVDAARSLQKRRELGSLSGKNVPTIMAEVLGAWVALERGTHSHTPISRTEFLDLENDT
jgi:hypothetical protein